MSRMCDLLAREQLAGVGIEIVSAASPCELSRKARALLVHDPGLGAAGGLRPHVVGDCSTLPMIREGALDFLIAGRVLERMHDPLGTVASWHRALRPGGRLLLAVLSAGRTGPRTPLSHLLWRSLGRTAGSGHADHAWIVDDLLEMLDYLRARGTGFTRLHVSLGPDSTLLLERPRVSVPGPAGVGPGRRILSLARKGLESLVTDGPVAFWRRLARFARRLAPAPGPYEAWVRSDSSRPAPVVEDVAAAPVFSVLTPVKDPDPEHLVETVRSVRAQVYPKWEHILADDGSERAEVQRALAAAANDRRVRLLRRDRSGGVVAASREALAAARGTHVALLDHDDLLHPHALAEVAAVARGAGFVYTDEDKLSAAGRREEPHFKPAWSPELMLSMMYTCHLAVFETGLARRCGGFREGTDGSQDYDLVLRIAEAGGRVVHVPRVLYHWRKAPGSTAGDALAKPWALEAASRVLGDALVRRGIRGRVEAGLTVCTHRIRREILAWPRVSVVIPTKDNADLLEACLEGVLRGTDYPDLEVVLVDNGSAGPRTAELYARLAGDARIKRVDRPGPFNFSRLVNEGARVSTGEMVVLLNNDVLVIDRGWLTALLEHAQRPEIGAVGAKLVYPGDVIQHAGIVVGLGGVAGNAFCRLPDRPPEPSAYAHVTREVSAVTGACMMVRRDAWERVAGFDEAHLPVAFNDVDFCLRLREAGYEVLYTPHSRLMHLESFSRGKDLDPAEVAYARERWAARIEDDPCYNPNLSRTSAGFVM